MEISSRMIDILHILEKKHSATVDYLAKQVYSSPSTVRRDLTTLENMGYVRRFHGGAALTSLPTATLPISYRMRNMSDTKKQIGLTAAQFVHNGDTIFIDSSSTASAMIPHLANVQRLKVITNSILAVQQLTEMDIEVYGLGGQLFHRSHAFVGQFAIDMLSNFYFDKMFFSTATLTADGILCDTTELENSLRISALSRSAFTYFMVDSSKVGSHSMLRLCHLRDLTAVISDADLPQTIQWEDDYPAFYRAEL